MKWTRTPALILVALLAACGGQQNAPTAPGQAGSYQAGIGINQRLEIYHLTGQVLGLGPSLQQYHTQGSAVFVNGTGSAYVSGGTSGKGFIRFHVTNVQVTGVPTTTAEFDPLVRAGEDVLLKTSDSKAASLVAGDTVTFRCRVQREFLEAVAGNEEPTTEKIVDELDYCRMVSPQFIPAPVAP